MYMNRKYLIFSTLVLFNTLFLVWNSLYVINNPDLLPYIELLHSLKSFGLNIEPTLYIFSTASWYLSNSLGLDPVFIFYYLYIFLMQFFLLLGFYNLTNRSILKSNILLLIWISVYGTIHGLIQIRFGLANAIFVYIYSFSYVKSSFSKISIFSLIGFFTHYSSILALMSFFMIYLRKVIFNKNSYKIVHISFMGFLLLFKFGAIFNILPSFLLGRISNYIGNDNLDSTSVISIYISLFCYIILVLSPKLNDEKLNSLKIYGAVGFLPYFIVPELEILIRLGIPFQYLLLVYLVLTYKYRKMLVYTTLPLMVFYGYKVYSNLNAFLGYLY